MIQFIQVLLPLLAKLGAAAAAGIGAAGAGAAGAAGAGAAGAGAAGAGAGAAGAGAGAAGAGAGAAGAGAGAAGAGAGAGLGAGAMQGFPALPSIGEMTAQGDFGSGIKDIYKGLEGLKHRQKQFLPLQEGIEALKTGVESAIVTGNPNSDLMKMVEAEEAKAMKPAAGGAGKSGAPGAARPEKPETFPALEGVVSGLEKLGGGVRRGMGALLSPVSGVLDVLSEPRMDLERLLTERAEKVAGIEGESRTGAAAMKAHEARVKSMMDASAEVQAAQLEKEGQIDAAAIKAKAQKYSDDQRRESFRPEDVNATIEGFRAALAEGDAVAADAFRQAGLVLGIDIGEAEDTPEGWEGVKDVFLKKIGWRSDKPKMKKGIAEFDPEKGLTGG